MQEIAVWFQMINWKCTEDEYQQALGFFSKERECIRNQFEKLSWKEEQHEQYNAINYLSENLFPWEYIYLVLANKCISEMCGGQRKYYRCEGGKERWGNAAKTIVQIGWPKVNNIIVPLFMWLLDPNWPGSELIYSFMLGLPENMLMSSMKLVAENPKNYTAYDYAELMALMEQLYQDKKAGGG